MALNDLKIEISRWQFFTSMYIKIIFQFSTFHKIKLGPFTNHTWTEIGEGVAKVGITI